MSAGLSNMEATGRSDMHKVLARVDFRGAPLQRVTRMRWEPVGTQRKTLRGGGGEITACMHERHSDPAAATVELGAEERHKNVLEVRFITVTCKISNEFSSCSNGGVLLFHVQWL